MQSVALPPPYQGQFDQTPIAAVESPYAQYCTNFNLDDGIPKVRHGDSTLYSSYNATHLNKRLLQMANYGVSTASKLIAVEAYSIGVTHYLKWTDVLTATVMDTLTPASSTTTEVYSLLFNGYLFYFGNGALNVGGAGPRYYDGTVWGNCGYTWPASFNPYGGDVYKSRAYIIGQNSLTYVYSGVSLIAGATTAVDLSSVVSYPAYLMMIKSIALSEGLQQENVQAFILSSGEVLVYSGSYPDSSDWKIIGRFSIPRPLSRNAFIDVGGDTYIITESGLISLRDLFQRGESLARTDNISVAITNRWDQVVGASFANTPLLSTPAVSGAYDSEQDRLIVTMPYYVGRDGVEDTSKFLRFVYSFKTKAWWEQVGDIGAASVVTAPVFTNGDVYYANYKASNGHATHVRKVEGASDYADATVDLSTGVAGFSYYTYQLRTAPLPIQKFGVSLGVGVEVITKGDLYTQTSYKLISDLGVTETLGQTITSAATGMTKPLINIGALGAYLQLDISGTTVASKTLGQEIHGLNLWANAGGPGSR